ncbi:general transcription factor II-I repeat domain-containing protein 2-like [Clavelina lepadiformis]|uniref:general transcription factor II-I repeat domain-containing protein 2-like n=1 Tax=Clavelina lepadiformis TaxID=159417 RepID=UPI004041FF62
MDCRREVTLGGKNLATILPSLDTSSSSLGLSPPKVMDNRGSTVSSDHDLCYALNQRKSSPKRPVNVTATRVSYEISTDIAAAGKSFTEGEFVKKCMLRAVSRICPREIEKFRSVSLSRTTVQRRVEDIAANLTNQLQQKVNEFHSYSLAVDESTDCTDIAQLLVFIRGIDDNFNVSENLAGMQSMKGRTTGKHICGEIVDCITTKLSADFKKLVGMCTDGAPAMCGKTKGAMSLLQEVIGRKIIAHHCIIHQQVLCSKVLKFDHVMSVAVSIVNYIRTRKVKHRLFKSFLEETGAEYGDVVYHTDVRWLSRGKVLKRFIALKDEIKKFLETEPKKFSELDDLSWNEDLFFLCDITSHLNDLNMKLQGKGQLIFDLFAAVNGFKAKLGLFKNQLLDRILVHFPTCSQHILQERHSAVGIKYAQQIKFLIEEFNSRLSLSSEEKLQLKIIENPFSIDPEEAPPHLQMEVIDLQTSSLYKTKYGESRCECGATEQTADHVINACPIHRPPRGVLGLKRLDEDTIKWLMTSCPEI